MRIHEIRRECLLQLYGAKQLGTTADLCHRRAKHAQLDFTHEEINDALFYLTQAGLAMESLDPVSGARRYVITAAGMTSYENNR